MIIILSYVSLASLRPPSFGSLNKLLCSYLNGHQKKKLELVVVLSNHQTWPWENHYKLVIEQLGDDILPIHTDYVWSDHWFLNALFVFLLVHRLLTTLMALQFDSAAQTQGFTVFFLTLNILVNKHSDFLVLGYLLLFGS